MISATQKLLAQNLKRIRQEKGFSQLYIAEHSGVIASTYSRIETCQVRPNLSTLEKLAEAMQVPMADFFKEEKEVERSVLEKFELLKQMSDYNQNVVEILMDALIQKDQLEQAQEVKVKKRLDMLQAMRGASDL